MNTWCIIFLPSVKLVMENTWKAYFIFTKKEQRGIMVLGCLMLASVAIGYFFPSSKTSEKSILVLKQSLFYFDPNTIDSNSALQLGIPPKQIGTLLHYRNKGGKFYKNEDLYKLYGLSKKVAEKLIPFVRIAPTNNKVSSIKYKTSQKKMMHTFNDRVSGSFNDRVSGSSFHSPIWTLDINTADSAKWAHLSKLPSSTIKNIIRYRNYLGGFTHLHQLKKVYGLSENEFYKLKPHLKIENREVLKPNANVMNFENWKSLGLFQDREIYTILSTRKQNGGSIGWRELVVLLDLTPQQADLLLTKVSIEQ